MKFFVPIGLLAILVFTNACKSKKVASTLPTPVAVEKAKTNEALGLMIGKIYRSKNLPEILKYSAVADYKDAKNSVTLNMELTAKKDQYIWMNAKAFGLVNVARIMLKPDSIRIIDLVNKKYISASYNYLNQFMKAPLSFNEMQNLVFGNAMFDPSLEQTTIDSNSNFLLMITQMGNLTQKASYDQALRANSVWLNEQGSTREMSIKYEAFEIVNGNSFPTSILINIEGEKKVECQFTLSNFATDVKQDPSFVIPKSYKVEVFK